MRYLFYSHDGLGLGHTRRHLAVAAALAKEAPASSILLATGAEEVVRHDLPQEVEIMKLPGLRKQDNQAYASRRLQISTGEIRALRSALLVTAVRGFRPDVVLVDKHPFGASGEFKAGLKALRRLGGKAVLGLRDILDEPANVLHEWRPYRMQQRILEYYDAVLVYGDRRVFDPIAAYEFPPGLADRTRFCGYVVARESPGVLENFEWPFPPREARTRPVVLATTGGGEDGFRVLRAFIAAAGRASWQGVVVAGPMTPEAELATLQGLARQSGVTLRRFVPHLSALFGAIDALVCMGGYNTLIEAVTTGVPTVCVPRVAPRTEQLLRARAFERLGLVQVCVPEQLETGALLSKIEEALRSSPARLREAAGEALDLNGGCGAASCLVSFGSLPRTANGGSPQDPRSQPPTLSGSQIARPGPVPESG